MIFLNNVSKTFIENSKRTSALKDISFHIDEGQFVSIVGPSGCGKTTLLKIIGGILEPLSGESLIQGISSRKYLKQGDIGFIFQNPNLMRWRTAIENVALPLEVKGRGDDGVNKVFDLVRLTGFEHYYPSKLSVGMQQRVAIARALIFDPPVLLMDEPFASLDEITKDELNLEISRLWDTRKTGIKSIVFVTHYISEAIFLSDKVIVLSKRPGKIKEIVEVDLERPRVLDIKHDERFVLLKKKIKRLMDKE